MSEVRSILVAGAGAVGLCCALRLAEAGFAVTLADPGAENASRVAAGMLAPAFESAMDDIGDFELLASARDMWTDLARGRAIVLEHSGAMGLAEPQTLDAWEATLRSVGAHVRRLTPGEAIAAQPGLAEPREALFTAEDWRIEPVQAMAALNARLDDLRVQRLPRRVGMFAEGVAHWGYDWARSWPSDAVVAAGGYSMGLGPELTVLRPIKGQIAFAPGAAIAGPAIRTEGLYVVPCAGGALVGATMEPGRADVKVEPDVVEALGQRARAFVRDLGPGPLLGRAGVRAATPDGMPIVGKSTQEGVFLAAGTRRNGWLLAPLIADEIVRAARGEEPSPRAARFGPQRFG